MGFTRDIIDETIANGFSNKKYRAQYEFYFHILAQCKVVISTDIETAGVRFANTKYILMINPEFFDPLPLTIRLGILKHEMLHILYNHTSRQEDRQQKQFNITADCAINQQIDRSHLDMPRNVSIKKEVKKLLKDPKKVEYIKKKKYKNIQELYDDLLTL